MHDPTIDAFFAGRQDSKVIFDALCGAIDSIGPSELRVSKSQIAFADGRIFARVWTPDQYLGSGHAPIVLTLGFRYRDPSARWKQIVEPAPGRFTHHLELCSPDDVDDQVRAWLAEAKADAAGAAAE